MKYITEEELRNLRKVREFETFTLMEGVKLTPGGRQFLVDRKIPIIVQGEQEVTKTISIPPNDRQEQREKTNCIDVHFALLEAIFFRQAMELFDRNQVLANQIYDMKCCLESIASGSSEKNLVMDLWDGMKKEQENCPQQEHFQLGRDVMFAEHGKEAAVLNLLRCELQKFCLEKDNILTADQKNYLSYMMKRLLHMIQTILGRAHSGQNVVE